jgi:uncharacterized protein YjbI with pentapeptide repeats
MANLIHLYMVRLTQNDWIGKGTWRFAWDVWRRNNPGKRLNLRNAWLYNVSLWGLDLSKVDFNNANLSHAYLSYANLSQADFSNTNLLEANLSNANLSEPNLSNANLLEANLEGANLSGANFSGAEIIIANLSNANLTRANLIGAKLGLTNLRNANLRGANLVGADLTKVNLIDANLCEANLEGAYLEGAELIRTNLIRANFKKACLFRTQVLDADFSSGNLTGACIESWNINSATNFEELECDHVYLKCKSEEFTLKFSDRRPSDPDANFASGEFVTLVKRSLETIDLIFVDGIDWKAFFDSFQELRWQYSDDDINVQTIERKGESFVIRLESKGVTDKAVLEAQAKEFYSKQLKFLEAQYEHKLQLQGANLEDARRTIETERHEKANLIGVISTMASNQQGPTYSLPSQEIDIGAKANMCSKVLDICS